MTFKTNKVETCGRVWADWLCVATGCGGTASNKRHVAFECSNKWILGVRIMESAKYDLKLHPSLFPTAT